MTAKLPDPTKKNLEDKFRSLNPDIIGVTSATLTYLPALEILKAAKTALPNCLTMIGGPHVTVMDEQAFTESTNVDIVVRGEGEQTMLELADLVSNGNLKNLSEVAGITFRKNGQVSAHLTDRSCKILMRFLIQLITILK